MKGIIIYKSKYGATAQYAQWLGSALHFSALQADEVKTIDLADFEIIVLGSAVYLGKLLLAKWIAQNFSALKNRKLFLFIVCGMRENERAAQEQVLKTNFRPDIRKRVQTFFIPGRCIIAHLSWTDRLLLRFAALANKDPQKEQELKHGFDRLNKSRLKPLIAAIRNAAGKPGVTQG